jgi:hypothetical protein
MNALIIFGKLIALAGYVVLFFVIIRIGWSLVKHRRIDSRTANSFSLTVPVGIILLFAGTLIYTFTEKENPSRPEEDKIPITEDVETDIMNKEDSIISKPMTKMDSMYVIEMLQIRQGIQDEREEQHVKPDKQHLQ